MLDEFQELASDNTSGATELIRKILALCEACVMGYDFDNLKAGLNLLEQSLKSMPSVLAVLHILKSEFIPRLQKEEDITSAISYLSSVEKILTESGAAIADRLVSCFSSPVSAVTISRSSTVLAALKKLNEHGLLHRVFVLEARPMLEGHRTIRDLDEQGITATLLVDAAMGVAVSKADIVVVGADSISADGYLLNKTGTFPLAICCKEFGVPLYVLSDSLKFSPRLRTDTGIEQRPAHELLIQKETDSFGVWNKYFEWTPVEYVKEFITERGAFTPDQLSALAGDDSNSVQTDSR